MSLPSSIGLSTLSLATMALGCTVSRAVVRALVQVDSFNWMFDNYMALLPVGSTIAAAGVAGVHGGSRVHQSQLQRPLFFEQDGGGASVASAQWVWASRRANTFKLILRKLTDNTSYPPGNDGSDISRLRWHYFHLTVTPCGERTAFDAKPPVQGPPIDALTELQQAVIRELSQVHSSNWICFHYMDILREWGLPSSYRGFWSA
ncbi:hypothetical protein GGX14DRAFT_554513 [Mycena pura]|uniref:Uncharacterized protein n=1 Tax=Mycena pura TaxID=153505 RepID=A0AAD6YSR3_9AGAR|nr:hypothetical protein GGX14DRAFT_554513 [Mycena pura]